MPAIVDVGWGHIGWAWQRKCGGDSGFWYGGDDGVMTFVVGVCPAVEPGLGIAGNDHAPGNRLARVFIGYV
ncbi:MAG: hypothetical protein MAG451_00045 [Anaerolineales bacterium]|nr:hypothetical protein [Anaerolineales bacterium]